MHGILMRATVGALALAGMAYLSNEARALQMESPTPDAARVRVEPVYYYGARGPFWRYGIGRPFLGYRRFGFRPYAYGYSRPLRPYGFRRPFYGYGYRRF